MQGCVTMRRLVVAVAAALCLSSVLVAAPSLAGGLPASATITKTVVGPGPADAVYEIEVDCEQSGATTVQLMDGESDTVSFFVGETCTVTETVDNDADSVAYTCETVFEVECLDDRSFVWSPMDSMGGEVDITVTNTFDHATTTTTAAPTTTFGPTTTGTPTTTAPAAQPVAAAPAFTG